ncbi:MAG: dihydropteroate synthase [Chitinophagaceae bacterium]
MKLNIEDRLVMGIINITPDSFYTQSASLVEKHIFKKVEKHIIEGADIIDIGAQSTRPNSELISSEEELRRILNPLKKIRKEFPNIPISIDTFYSEVAYACIQENVQIINDISAGQMDLNMLNMIGKFPHISYVLMHMQGMPKIMQQCPLYTNVVDEVYSFFQYQLRLLNENNIYNIILDVGFGFGKTTDHNYQLLKKLSRFQDFKKPILVGISRKSMIYKVLKILPEDALNGTNILNTFALFQGTQILRVHDVKEAKECIKLYEFYISI